MKLRIISGPKAAFTLIELLTVIAIIGILAAILIPVVGKVRANARSAQCASNLRQVASALLLYAGDNKNQLPAVSASWPPPADDKGTWLYKTWPYAGYTQSVVDQDIRTFRSANTVERNHAFVCPATHATKTQTPVFGNFTANPNMYSYGLNCLTDTAAGWTSPVRLGSAPNPSVTFMVSEVSYPLGTSSGYRSWYGLLPHGDAANFAFYDGHVERRSKAAIPDLSTAAKRMFWTGQ